MLSSTTGDSKSVANGSWSAYRKMASRLIWTDDVKVWRCSPASPACKHHCQVNITVWPQAWEAAAIAISTIKTFKFIVWLLSVHFRLYEGFLWSKSSKHNGHTSGHSLCQPVAYTFYKENKEEAVQVTLYFTWGPMESIGPESQAVLSVVGILCLSGTLRKSLLLVATRCMGTFYLMK